MASIDSIPGMRARALTIMATRARDQELVESVASRLGGGAEPTVVVPSFGWHPWFSHLLYDDSPATGHQQPDGDDATVRRKHLAAVLTPAPADSANSAAGADEDVIGLLAPELRPLSGFLAETRARLRRHQGALVGEIGIDRAFRLPWPEAGQTKGGLSPYRVRPEHQARVLLAQLALAADEGRAVSVHGVQAHGLLLDTLTGTWRGHERAVASRRVRRMAAPGAEAEGEEEEEEEEEKEEKEGEHGASKPYPGRICLHSFSGPPEILRRYVDRRVPARVFFSFSTAVNFTSAAAASRTAHVVAACPDDRVLAESDLHVAGPRMDAALEDVCRRICAIKGWPLREGVARMGRNFQDFISSEDH